MIIFVYHRFDQKSVYWKYLRLSFPQYLKNEVSMDTTFGINISNEKLLSAARWQVYSFYRFWFFKEKPTKGGGWKYPTFHPK